MPTVCKMWLFLRAIFEALDWRLLVYQSLRTGRFLYFTTHARMICNVTPPIHAASIQLAS
jgi:hypothetical protein